MRSLVIVAAALIATSTAVVVLRAPAPEPQLYGLWSRLPLGNSDDGAPMNFYYFHNEGGIGLYRYGKVAYNTTNSYHWSVDGDDIVLDYNKSGSRVRVPYRIEKGTRPVLVLVGDPRTPGQAETRYAWLPPMQQADVAPDLFGGDDDDAAATSPDSLSSDRVDNRLWMDFKSFKTGGNAFSLYQLRQAGIDGRGTGWHHVGDFDDWSTESFAYRLVRLGAGDRLEGDDGAGEAARGLDLVFNLRQERATTALRTSHRSVGGKDVRFLTMSADPRDFQAPHEYRDAGPSFAAFWTDPDAAAHVAARVAGADVGRGTWLPGAAF